MRLCLAAPHIETARKLYREEPEVCSEFFEGERAADNDEDNLYYAYGICCFENGENSKARELLKISFERAYAPKRKEYIGSMLNRLS